MEQWRALANRIGSLFIVTKQTLVFGNRLIGNISNLESKFQVQDGGEVRERMQWEISYSKLDLLFQIENGLLSVVNIANKK